MTAGDDFGFAFAAEKVLTLAAQRVLSRLKILLDSGAAQCTHHHGSVVVRSDDLGDRFEHSGRQKMTAPQLFFASAIAWGPETAVQPGCLGTRYEEFFRKFLLGEAAFPANTAVNVHVYFDDEPTTFMAFPIHKKITVGSHRFSEHPLIAPGLTFKIWVGGGVGQLEQIIGARPGYPTFFETIFRGSDLQRRLSDDAKSLSSKGKLARS